MCNAPLNQTLEELTEAVRHAADGWLEEFRDANGIQSLFDVLRSVQDKVPKTAADVLIEEECVAAITAFADSHVGFEYLIADDGLLSVLLASILSESGAPVARVCVYLCVCVCVCVCVFVCVCDCA